MGSPRRAIGDWRAKGKRAYQRGVMPETAIPATGHLPDLPSSFWQAALRGLRGHCPRCGGARLFARWLKPAGSCAACAQDWAFQRADDFPAYIAILLTGHILAPVIIVLIADLELSPGALALILLPLATAMMLGMLQPAKGAVIAAQWWHGLHGFHRERRAGD